MPLMKVDLSVPIEPARRAPVLRQLSRTLSEITGKPEAYTMVTLQECAMSFAGTEVKGAFVDIRGIGGLSPEVNRKLSKAIAGILKEEFQIVGEQVYITFTEVAATHWGWKGATFG